VSNIEKWLDRVYGETDFGRSIATAVAGLIALVTYLAVRDWVISACAGIIAFPIARLTAVWLYDKARRAAQFRLDRANARRTYGLLSDEERQVVQEFVRAGGCVLTWSHMNTLAVSGPAVESLLQREILTTSMTADSMRETFVLDAAIFDASRSSRELTSP